MADIVSSLFGLTPAQIRLQQQQQDRQFAQDIAETQATPYAKERALLGATVGSGLVRGVAGLLGIQDPQLAKASAVEGILQQVNNSLTPEERADPSLMYQRLAQEFAKNPMTQREAFMAQQQSQTAALEVGKIGSEINKNVSSAAESRAKATAALQEKLPNIEKLIAARDRAPTEEGKATIQKAIDKEVQANQASIEQEIVILSTKKANGTITQKELEQLDYLDNFKTRVAKAGATNISNVDKSLSAKTGDLLASELPGANASVDAIMAVSDIRNAINSGKVIVGPGATLRTTLAQFANVYAGGSNEQQLANTRQAIRGLADLALTARSRLKGTGAISNYEQQIVEKATTGNIENLTIPEIKVLTDVVERSAKSTYNDYTRKLQSVNDPALLNFYSPKPMPGAAGADIDSIVEKHRTK